MHPELNAASQANPFSLPERIERVYLFLEQLARYEAKSFSDSSKACLRRAQAELQRMRLELYDLGSNNYGKNK
jgi:hypothetical protein